MIRFPSRTRVHGVGEARARHLLLTLPSNRRGARLVAFFWRKFRRSLAPPTCSSLALPCSRGRTARRGFGPRDARSARRKRASCPVALVRITDGSPDRGPASTTHLAAARRRQ